MGQSSIINQIRNSRDTALAALDSSVTAVRRQIEQTTVPDPELSGQMQKLTKQRAAIRAAATDAVLALPDVIAAAASLNTLSRKMQAAAQALPDATKVLTAAATILALGQQFSDKLTNAQNG